MRDVVPTRGGSCELAFDTEKWNQNVKEQKNILREIYNYEKSQQVNISWIHNVRWNYYELKGQRETLTPAEPQRALRTLKVASFTLQASHCMPFTCPNMQGGSSSISLSSTLKK